tara:strand:+ start:7880 stop:8881 length:1002 start_codon:yes stop_codon:yes gene_type:complete
MNTSYDKINNVCLIIIASVATVSALIYTKIVLIPFVISVFFFAAISPLIKMIQTKLKAPRPVAVVTCFLILGIVTALTWLLVIQSFMSFYDGIDTYKAKAIGMVEDISIWAGTYGFELEPDFIQQEIMSLPLVDWIKEFTGGLASFLGNAFLIFVFTIFLIIGEKHGNLVKESLWMDVKTKVSRYIIIKFFSSFLTGVSVCILLLFFNVELAFVFAFITFLLNFIPNVGSIVAATLPMPIILLNQGLGITFFAVLTGQMIIHTIIGTIVEPKLLGERMDLHPIAILMFLIFWGLVWGIPGMFLAVPITAVFKFLFARIESTKAFSEILAGRIS